MFDRPKSRFRYSLRGLLIGVTLLCALMGWLASRLWDARKQAAAVQELESAYVVVGYDYMLNSNGEYTGSDTPPTGFLRQHLGNDFFSKVIRVAYSAGSLPEFGLSPLADVRGLRNLSLRGTCGGRLHEMATCR